jgi:hypothetical protein
MYEVDGLVLLGGMSGGGIFEIYINIRLFVRLADVDDDDDVLMLESQEMNFIFLQWSWLLHYQTSDLCTS